MQAFMAGHSIAIIAAFICRLTLYTASCAVAVGVKGFEPETGRSLVISCLQILMVACAMTLYTVCAWLLSELKNATGYREVDGPELSTHCPTEEHSSVLAEAPDPRASVPHTEPIAPRQEMKSVDLEVSGRSSRLLLKKDDPPAEMRHLPEIQANIDFLSRADSEGSSPGPPADNVAYSGTHIDTVEDAPWVFSSAVDLQQYVARVHIIGFVLWATVIGVDFSHPSLLVAFTSGLFCGVMMTQGRLRSSSRHKSLMLCTFFVYSVLFTVVLATCFVYTHVDFTDSSLVLFLGVVGVTGLLWGVQSPSPRILSTAQSAFITTTLMSVPILFLLSTLDDIEYLVHRDMLGSLYVLVLEPLIKFLNIYALVISIKTNRAVELSVILASVLCLLLLIQNSDQEHPEPLAIAGCVAVALLFVVHIVHLYALHLD